MALTLEIKAREEKKPNALRREGIVPATVYGPDMEPASIQLEAKAFSKISFEDHKHLINLVGGPTEYEVLIKNVQKDFLTREVLNIEFYKVMKGHKLNAKVGIKFVGESKAVKLGAELVTIYKEVHVRCLPKDIPNYFEIDVSKLENPDDHITFADINVDRSIIEVLDPAAEIICKAQLSRKSHAVEAPAAAAAATPAAGATPAAAPAAKAAAAKPAAKK